MQREKIIIFCQQKNEETVKLLVNIKNNIQVYREKYLFEVIKVNDNNYNNLRKAGIIKFPSFIYRKRVISGLNNCLNFLREDDLEYDEESIARVEAEKYRNGDKGEEDYELEEKIMNKKLKDLTAGKSIYSRNFDEKKEIMSTTKPQPKKNYEEDFTEDNMKDYMLGLFNGNK